MKFEFHETCILNNISKFTEKHICLSLFFKKLQDSNCSFIKNEIGTSGLPGSFGKFSRTAFLQEHFWVTASVVSRISS